MRRSCRPPYPRKMTRQQGFAKVWKEALARQHSSSPFIVTYARSALPSGVGKESKCRMVAGCKCFPAACKWTHIHGIPESRNFEDGCRGSIGSYRKPQQAV